MAELWKFLFGALFQRLKSKGKFIQLIGFPWTREGKEVKEKRNILKKNLNRLFYLMLLIKKLFAYNRETLTQKSPMNVSKGLKIHETPKNNFQVWKLYLKLCHQNKRNMWSKDWTPASKMYFTRTIERHKNMKENNLDL